MPQDAQHKGLAGQVIHQEKQSCRAKPGIILPEDLDGWPILPGPDPAINGKALLENSKALVRAFITAHYRLATGGMQSIVPWAMIVDEPRNFIEKEYLPALSNSFKEPSRMCSVDAEACLGHWRLRQATCKPSKVFRFKRIILKRTRVHMQYDLTSQGVEKDSTPRPSRTKAPKPKPVPPPRPAKARAKNVVGPRRVRDPELPSSSPTRTTALKPGPCPPTVTDTNPEPAMSEPDPGVEPGDSEPEDGETTKSSSDQADAQVVDTDELRSMKHRYGRTRLIVHSPSPIPVKPSKATKGQKRSADKISTDNLNGQQSIPKQIAPRMPPPRDLTIPVVRRGPRLTSSFLNPHPEADDYLHRHEAEAATKKKADPPRTAGPLNVPPQGSPRRGTRECIKTQKKKLFEEAIRGSATKTIFEGERPVKRRRV